jgi:hypothetical protein
LTGEKLDLVLHRFKLIALAFACQLLGMFLELLYLPLQLVPVTLGLSSTTVATAGLFRALALGATNEKFRLLGQLPGLFGLALLG